MTIGGVKMYGIVLMIAFALYIVLDYFSHEKNNYKLLFLIPILMSTVLLTSVPSTWTASFFLFYRTLLILVCFVVAIMYFTNLRKRKSIRKQQLTQRQKEQQEKLRQQKAAKATPKKKGHK